MTDYDLAAVERIAAASGFGIVMGIILVAAIISIGLKPGGFSILFLGLFGGLFGFVWAEFAMSIRFDRVLNPESLKAVGAVAAAIFGLWVAWKAIERMPATALLACTAVLSGCALTGALALYAPPKNLLLLVIVVGLIAFVAIIAICALALDRKHAREIQNSRVAVNAPLAPDSQYLPREVNRGRLSAPPKGGLPAKRYGSRDA